ncbi:MAG: radical SAM protein, partial [Firmicutes bacterium]|nr:radical SAM protein [Bacillota bacterium]
MRTLLPRPSRYNHYVELGGQGFLVFNALSGVLALVDGRSAREHLGLEQIGNLKAPAVRLESDDAEPATVEDFLAAGFLVHPEVDELEVYRHRWYAAQLDPSVVSLTICPTMRCNMNCVYCFEDRDGADMASEVADALVGWVQRWLERARTLNVLWFGGEPLLRPDFIEELSARLVEAARQVGAEYHAGIFTNGYCLGPRELETLERSLIREVVIPLDGPEEVHEKRRPHVDGKPVFARILENGARASE